MKRLNYKGKSIIREALREHLKIWRIYPDEDFNDWHFFFWYVQAEVNLHNDGNRSFIFINSEVSNTGSDELVYLTGDCFDTIVLTD